MPTTVIIPKNMTSTNNTIHHATRPASILGLPESTPAAFDSRSSVY
ncbi:hypothetical protein [Nocardia sp. NBC_01388]